uniref:Uncharacterized protein n=1 Tax=Setaria digitata TaxID=48799 RepID=A0A915PZ30_9BILA
MRSDKVTCAHAAVSTCGMKVNQHGSFSERNEQRYDHVIGERRQQACIRSVVNYRNASGQSEFFSRASWSFCCTTSMEHLRHAVS